MGASSKAAVSFTAFWFRPPRSPGTATNVRSPALCATRAESGTRRGRRGRPNSAIGSFSYFGSKSNDWPSRRTAHFAASIRIRPNHQARLIDGDVRGELIKRRSRRAGGRAVVAWFRRRLWPNAIEGADGCVEQRRFDLAICGAERSAHMAIRSPTDWKRSTTIDPRPRIQPTARTPRTRAKLHVVKRPTNVNRRAAGRALESSSAGECRSGFSGLPSPTKFATAQRGSAAVAVSNSILLGEPRSAIDPRCSQSGGRFIVLILQAKHDFNAPPIRNVSRSRDGARAQARNMKRRARDRLLSAARRLSNHR